MYEYAENGIWKPHAKDGPQQLSNFTAKIIKETRMNNGISTQVILTIEGSTEKEKLQAIEVNAEKYAAMSWVASEWGTSAMIFPGGSVKDDLRAAIQIASNPIKETVYTHTGWTKINGKDVFLHTNGAISKNGNDEKTRVVLPNDMSNYRFENPKKSIKNEIITCLKLIDIAPGVITWPLFAAVFRAVLGSTDFAIHISGRTGTFKSELASLFQSFFGSKMHARKLPGSWGSTANALEALTFRGKDVMFVIDDFIPTGTSWHIRQMQKTADQLIRGQGNQAGRARLTDTSNLQQTFFPRGIILSTGEDIPEGHSIRSRMFIIEIAPNDVDVKKLTIGQKNRDILQIVLSAFIQFLATNKNEITTWFNNLREKYRNTFINQGHARTPGMVGDLIAAIEVFTLFALKQKAITQALADSIVKLAKEQIKQSSSNQMLHITESDPADIFIAELKNQIASKLVYFRSRSGGIPKSAETFGWTEETTRGDLPTYKPHGRQLGWVDWNDDELLLNADMAFETIKRQSRGAITLTKQTLYKRLREAGYIVRSDSNRNRNTIRSTCEGTTKNVLVLSLSATLSELEKPA